MTLEMKHELRKIYTLTIRHPDLIMSHKLGEFRKLMRDSSIIDLLHRITKLKNLMRSIKTNLRAIVGSEIQESFKIVL